MTDEESRNAAWFEWLSSDACVSPYDRNAWNAAWAEATERERDRYAMLNNDYQILRHNFRECTEEIVIFSRHATQEAIGEISALRYRRQSILGPMGTLKEPKP